MSYSILQILVFENRYAIINKKKLLDSSFLISIVYISGVGSAFTYGNSPIT